MYIANSLEIFSWSILGKGDLRMFKWSLKGHKWSCPQKKGPKRGIF